MENVLNPYTVSAATVLTILLLFGVHAALGCVIFIGFAFASISMIRERALSSAGYGPTGYESPPIHRIRAYSNRMCSPAFLQAQSSGIFHNADFKRRTSCSANRNEHQRGSSSNPYKSRSASSTMPKRIPLPVGQFPRICLASRPLPMLSPSNTRMICKPVNFHVAPWKDRFMPATRLGQNPKHSKSENRLPRNHLDNPVNGFVQCMKTIEMHVSLNPNVEPIQAAMERISANCCHKHRLSPVELARKKFKTNEIEASLSSSRHMFTKKSAVKRKMKKTADSSQVEVAISPPVSKVARSDTVIRKLRFEDPPEKVPSESVSTVSSASDENVSDEPMLVSQSGTSLPQLVLDGTPPLPKIAETDESVTFGGNISSIGKRSLQFSDETIQWAIKKAAHAEQAKLDKLLAGIKEAFEAKDRKNQILAAQNLATDEQHKVGQVVNNNIIPGTQTVSPLGSFVVSTNSTMSTAKSTNSALTSSTQPTPSISSAAMLSMNNLKGATPQTFPSTLSSFPSSVSASLFPSSISTSFPSPGANPPFLSTPNISASPFALPSPVLSNGPILSNKKSPPSYKNSVAVGSVQPSMGNAVQKDAEKFNSSFSSVSASVPNSWPSLTTTQQNTAFTTRPSSTFPDFSVGANKLPNLTLQPQFAFGAAAPSTCKSTSIGNSSSVNSIASNTSNCWKTVVPTIGKRSSCNAEGSLVPNTFSLFHVGANGST